MAKRHWLLIGAGAALLYGFGFIRSGLVLSFYPIYSETDIASSVFVAVALLAAWCTLEVTHQVLIHRRTACPCGYSLKGVKCPECGRDVGTGAV
ncbi:MAG: hypothetical protein IPM33_08020 [Phycisphaerales bacterium]|nr:hypothetical protein [Phycisphaerales bacterium]